MGFQFKPKSVTLNDLERHNGRISPNSVAFGAHYVKVVEDTPILSAKEMYPKNLMFSDIQFMAIFTGYQAQ